MQNSVAPKPDQQGKASSPPPPTFIRKLGATTFIVSVYPSETSKETVEDKLLRLIERGVRNSA